MTFSGPSRAVDPMPASVCMTRQ